MSAARMVAWNKFSLHHKAAAGEVEHMVEEWLKSVVKWELGGHPAYQIHYQWRAPRGAVRSASLVVRVFVQEQTPPAG